MGYILTVRRPPPRVFSLGQRITSNLPTRYFGNPEVPQEEWEWGPVTSRAGRLIGIVDNGDGTATLTLQFDEAGYEIETRYFKLKEAGWFILRIPTLDPIGPLIWPVDDGREDAPLSADQKMELFNYLAAKKVIVEVRDGYDGTDFVICYGCQ